MTQLIGFTVFTLIIGVPAIVQTWASRPARDRGRNVAPDRKEDTPCL
jgi:hypothetical protein